MEAVQTQPVYPNGLDFQQVWAALMENREQLKETDRIIKEVGELQKETARRQEETALQMKETDRQMKETMKETDRQIKEIMKETDRRMDDFNKRFGEFTNRFGEVVEYMIAPNLREKFWEMGLKFNQANTNAVFANDNKEVLFEVDVLLQNGDKAMLVEVKTKLTTEDVNDHIARLEKMRNYADLRGDKRAFLGAVAGVVMTTDVKRYALGQGFFVIEPSGETFNITPPNGNPKEW